MLAASGDGKSRNMSGRIAELLFRRQATSLHLSLGLRRYILIETDSSAVSTSVVHLISSVRIDAGDSSLPIALRGDEQYILAGSSSRQAETQLPRYLPHRSQAKRQNTQPLKQLFKPGLTFWTSTSYQHDIHLTLTLITHSSHLLPQTSSSTLPTPPPLRTAPPPQQTPHHTWRTRHLRLCGTLKKTVVALSQRLFGVSLKERTKVQPAHGKQEMNERNRSFRSERTAVYLADGTCMRS